jgi:MvdD pre-ATP grasp domain
MTDLPILVVTSIDDVTSDLVIGALNERGVPVVRADPTQIGNDLFFSAGIGAGREEWDGTLSTGTRDLRLSRVRSVYWRRPGPWRYGHLPEQAREFATAEARHGLTGLLSALPALYVPHPTAAVIAEYKPVQLKVAAELGFTVPATLITLEYAPLAVPEHVTQGRVPGNRPHPRRARTGDRRTRPPAPLVPPPRGRSDDQTRHDHRRLDNRRLHPLPPAVARSRAEGPAATSRQDPLRRHRSARPVTYRPPAKNPPTGLGSGVR